jgi:hypothetical protein
MVYNDVSSLEQDLKNLDKDPCVLLLMTTGNFSGLDLKSLAREVVGS